jgi:hypothetical protein
MKSNINLSCITHEACLVYLITHRVIDIISERCATLTRKIAKSLAARISNLNYIYRDIWREGEWSRFFTSSRDRIRADDNFDTDASRKRTAANENKTQSGSHLSYYSHKADLRLDYLDYLFALPAAHYVLSQHNTRDAHV